jgi:hypothetical protein
MENYPQAWFSALGEPLGEGERNDIAGYLLGLGLRTALPVVAVGSWQQAAALAQTPAGDWWDAEEAERQRLEQQAKLDPSDRAWLATTEAVHGAAAVAAARAGGVDSGLVRAAAGAAIYASYEYRLATAACAPPEHPFMRKYALFCGGRWPLGIYGDRFAIF